MAVRIEDLHALQTRVDRDTKGVISNLDDVVSGLTDADDVYWDDWSEEAKSDFLRPYGFDPATNPKPPDVVLNEIFTDLLPGNVISVSVENYLQETGQTVDEEAFKLAFPRQEVDAELRLNLSKGMDAIGYLPNRMPAGSQAPDHLPHHFTDEGARDHARDLVEKGVEVINLTEREEVCESVKQAVGSLSKDEHAARAKLLIEEIENGDDSKVQELQRLFMEASDDESMKNTPNTDAITRLMTGTQALDKVEGPYDLTWDKHEDGWILTDRTDRLLDNQQHTDPVVESVSYLSSRGTVIGTADYPPSTRAVRWEDSQEGRGHRIDTRIRMRDFDENLRNQQAYAELRDKTNLTPAEAAEKRRIEAWADTDGDGVPDIELNWVSQHELATNPYAIVPDLQRNPDGHRAAVLREQNEKGREMKEEYEYGDTTSIHAGGEAGRNQLFTEDPIVVNRDSEDLWTLNNGMLETATLMAKLDPDSANQVATLWVNDPVEAQRLALDFEAKWGITVMDDDTRYALEYRASIPRYLQPQHTDSSKSQVEATMEQSALMEGMPIQRTLNGYMEQYSEVLAEMDRLSPSCGPMSIYVLSLGDLVRRLSGARPPCPPPCTSSSPPASAGA